MHAPIHGTLISADFARRELLPELERRLTGADIGTAHARFARWWKRVSASLGPASGLTAVVDVAATPLFQLLGFRPRGVETDLPSRLAHAALAGPGSVKVNAIVSPWGEDIGRAWRDAVRLGLRAGTRWCLCFNGGRLRLVDTERSWARRFLEFDLATCAGDPEAFLLLWGLARPDAFATRLRRRGLTRAADGSLLDDVVGRSARHTLRVCAGLRDGVRTAWLRLVQALERNVPRHGPAPGVNEQALTLVFRVLFLMYAEARGLVPLWHPIYRESYSIESLREGIARGEPPLGFWEALQAIARLAHDGCCVETLRVAPFNGPLFAPNVSPLLERSRVDDAVVREVLLELGTTSSRRGHGERRPILFSDLGVEQLGAVYERLLDDLPPSTTPAGNALASGVERARPRREPAPASRRGMRSARGAGHPSDSAESSRPPDTARKATGAFYTPRSITDYLVRRTLHPLVAEATPDHVLSLRVLDPAMGSGAFLVAACRFLAAAYESALVRTRQARGGDIGEGERAAFRRLVAQRCLFGVDLNPMAVHLARLSLWLATLSAGKPLTFLDHRLRVGDSLVGASAADLARQPPGAQRGSRRPASLPLFEAGDLVAAWIECVPGRWRLATESDDSLDIVRGKTRLLRALEAGGTALDAWKRLADLWCAIWLWNEPTTAPPASAFASLCDAVRGRSCALPPRQRDAWLAAARAIAARSRYFHWTFEFPEVFVASDGQPRLDGGFDAILGNPPWDVVRGDTGMGQEREAARSNAERLTRFVRDAGLYTGACDAHVNRYQLFFERSLSLLRAGGRLGLVVPWGLFADHGSAALRRRLIERCRCDAIVSFENRRGVFPIHRSLRFALLTATSGGRTVRLRCRLGEGDPAVLDRLPDTGGGASAFPVALPLGLLERVSGERIAVPDLRRQDDVRLLDRLFAAAPPLSAPGGWNARFGRELNATEDRRHFETGEDGLPVLEGKHLQPFLASPAAARLRLPEEAAARLLDAASTWLRPRLAYRDVASPTNRLTLIAAVVPARTVTTHTVFCLKTPLDESEQWFLCGLLNSFVLNWLARLWVTTHLTVALVGRLPAPRPPHASSAFTEIAGLAARLGRKHASRDSPHARLQAAVARLYGLDRDEFRHLLDSFPLVPTRERADALDAYDRAGDGPTLVQ